jgi:small subunit ribosomal protein S7
MPRRREIPKRRIPPDGAFESALASRFINKVMARGKRSVAERVFYGAMDRLRERTGEDPLKVFKKALDNVKPIVETKSRRVGGSTYQVPVEVNPHRRTSLAIRWLVSCARARHEKTMMERLANELMDASTNRGGAVRKREDVYRMAEANKAFAHYRW